MCVSSELLDEFVCAMLNKMDISFLCQQQQAGEADDGWCVAGEWRGGRSNVAGAVGASGRIALPEQLPHCNRYRAW